MRILLVDKLASFRKRVRSWLVDGGHSTENILEAPGGAPAMEILRREDFNVDAIVCEWEQQTVGALALLQQIRAVPGFAHIGFVAVGPADAGTTAEAKGAGATHYLSQPLDPEHLLVVMVDLEKAAILHRKKTPSPTTRWRILTLDRKPDAGKTEASLTAAAETELRHGARTVYLGPGESLTWQPGSGLYWLEKGSLDVRESRQDGQALAYKLGPGQFLGEAAFGGCPTLAVEAVSSGESWLASRDAISVEQLRARHPVLFYSFRNIATERARRYSVAEKRPVERGLAGEIDSLPVGDLMQILNGARKTGVLKIDAESTSFFFQFTDGLLRHAEADGDVGEEVFYRALLLDAGRFEFMVGPAIAGPVTVATETQKLLIEGLRRRAERQTKSRPPRTRPAGA